MISGKNYYEMNALIEKYAKYWAIKYHIAYDECESELLIVYAIALKTYDPSKHASFNTWFFWKQKEYGKKFYKAEKKEYLLRKETIPLANDFTDDFAVKVLQEIAAESILNADGKIILELIQNIDWGKKRPNKKMVYLQAKENLNWGRTRVEKALSNIFLAFYI